jgi:hypothetical protein
MYHVSCSSFSFPCNPPGVGINSRPHRMEKQCKRLGTKRKEPDENLSFETQKLTVEKDT